MKDRSLSLGWFGIVFFGLAVSLWAESTSQYETVKALCLPAQYPEKVFSPLTNQANFTVFSNVNNVTVTTNGTLAFALTATNAVLGWGNYAGVQAATNVQDLWEEKNDLYLRVKQSGTNSKWVAQWWVDGAPMASPAPITNTFAISGTFSNLCFALSYARPTPDGLELRVTGSVGDQFEIGWIKMVQPLYEGYARKEFVLPTGTVWRAVATVGGMPELLFRMRSKIQARLYVNGQEVERRGSRSYVGVAPVNLAPYLQPGTNCVAFYGYQVTVSPYLLFHTRIEMESGQTIGVKSDTTWKSSPTNAAGWNEPGFDDSSWTTISNLSASYSVVCYTNEFCVLKNPLGKDFFYTDDTGIAFEVRAPDGLAAVTPVLDYTFSRADAAGKLTPVSQGTNVAYTSMTNASLVYTFNVGQHERGVYTIACKLRGTNSVIEETPPEPVMVIRKLNLTEIQGTNWYEGLNLELEDTIDFTDPSDPHPWIEAATNTSIVTTNGLTYRETVGYYFSYRFQFEQPGAFYLLELEYPDDADREFEVGIANKYPGITPCDQSGVGVCTGGRFFKTGKTQTLRWIHVADSGVHSVDIVNIGANSGMKAAAKSFKVYRILGDLPAVASGTNRLFGIHTERCIGEWNSSSGIAMNFGIDQCKTSQQKAEESQIYSPLELTLQELIFYQDTAERYTQYLKFCGQNTHIMGVYQYDDDNTPFEHPSEIDTARIVVSLRSVLANTLNANGISFYAGVEWSHCQAVSGPVFANNAQVAKGADTIWMVDTNGCQYYGFGSHVVVLNWIHPLVSNQISTLAEEVTDKFGHLSGYKGIHGFLGPNQGSVGYWVPGFGLDDDYTDPFHFSFDDATFQRFEAETGVSLGVSTNDPQRFAQRSILIHSPAYRSTYVNWRCQRLQTFLKAGLAGLRHQTNNVQFLCTLGIEDTDFFHYWLSQGLDYDECIKDFGIDLDLLAQVEGLSIGRWTVSWAYPGNNDDPYLWLPKVDSRITSAYTDITNRYVIARSSWQEGLIQAPGYSTHGPYGVLVESDWIMDWTRTRTHPQPGGYNCRETLIQGLISADANILMSGFCDAALMVGNEQEIREIIRVFTHLPPEKFETVLETGFESNFVIRKLVKDGVTWFYLVNPGYWHVVGSVTLTADCDLLDVVTEEAAPVEQRDGKVILPVTLAPYGLVAYKANSAVVTFESSAVETIAADELAYMESLYAQLNALLAWGDQIPNRAYLVELVGRIRQALDEGNYGKAWSLLTQTEAWLLLTQMESWQGYWPQYYVATNGNDAAAGTNWATALRTISNAVARVNPWAPTSVIVSNGLYMLTTNIVVTNGITLRSWNNGALDPTNTILDGGGVTRCLYINNTNALVTGFTITNGNGVGNTPGYGGGVYIGGAVAAGGTLSNCIVIGNTMGSSGVGGGVYLWGSASLVTDCRVIGNIAGGSGGGAYLYCGATIRNSTLDGNRSHTVAAGEGGGGVWMKGYYLAPTTYYSIADTCQIINNTASNYGGGVLMSGVGTKLLNSAVSNNTQVNDGAAGYAGGGIYLSTPYSALITNCVIESNSGYDAGGVYVMYGGVAGLSVTFSNCVIRNNTGRDTGGGTGGAGGTFAGGTNIPVTALYNTLVEGNTSSGYYGGVFLYCGAAIVDGCVIRNNTGLRYGGLLIIAGRGPSTVRNCVIAGNTNTTISVTKNYTGGVWIPSNTFVESCTIVRNAGNRGGLYISADGGMVSNTIVMFNTGAVGSNWSAAAGVTPQFAYGCTMPTNGLTGAGNIAVDPLFVDLAAGNYRLSLGSPCLNTGSNQDWMTGALDLDGAHRIWGGQVDLGAYERQVMNIKVDPTLWTATCVSNGVTNRAVAIWNAAAMTDQVYVTLSATNNWLNLGLTNLVLTGSETGTVWLTNDATGLAPGAYAGSVMLTATNGTETGSVTCAVSVQLGVYVAGLETHPGGLTNTVWLGNQPLNQTFTIVGLGSEDTSYTITTTAPWLTVDGGVGVVGPGETNTVMVSYGSTAGWAGGVSNGEIRVVSDMAGGITQMVSVVLTVQELELAAPTGVGASDGTDSNGVWVTWLGHTNAVGYTVWRNTGADPAGAVCLSGTRSSMYAYLDMTAAPGSNYYYWVKATNGASASALSVSNSGYRGLSAPAVSASDGVYADKVQLTWAVNSNALGYQVWRGLSADTNAAVKLSDTSDLSYADISAIPGTSYWYWVQATNAVGLGLWGNGEAGYRSLAAPTAVTASDGVYSNKVRVTWSTNGCTNATGYVVWRNPSNDLSSAGVLAALTGTNYDDTSAVSNVVYYYWVQATNATASGAGSFSASDIGYLSSRILYVAANGSDLNAGVNWSTALRTISNAVARANLSAPSTVLVSNGLYTLTTNIVVTNAIYLRSWNNGDLDPTNTILDGGGVTRCLYINRTNALVAGFTITNGNGVGNTPGYGGGVYIGGTVAAGGTLSNCIVAVNTASQNGGGVHLHGSASLVTDCRVIGNIASGSGGGAYLYCGATIRNSTLDGNRSHTVAAGEGGGGVWMKGYYLAPTMYYSIADTCQIINNTVSNYGGGVLMSGVGTKLLNSTVSSNTQTNAVGAAGGVYLYTPYSALITNCVIASNSGYDAGGVYVLYGSAAGQGVTFSNCVIRANTAGSAGGYGGVGHTFPGGTNMPVTAMYNTMIEGNTTIGLGGGVSLYRGAIIDGCVIRNNQGVQWGGLVIKISPGTSTVRNCVIAGNTNTSGYATKAYVAGLNIPSNTFVESCTIVSNVATHATLGRGGLCFEAEGGTVSNTIVMFNKGSLAGASNWSVVAGATPRFAYGCTMPTNGLTGAGNLAADPQFVGLAAGNYRLSSTSPCLNAGSNQDWMTAGVDLDGNQRIYNTMVDLGAYERNVLDPESGAPTEVAASDGTYLDRVQVAWNTSACTNINGYAIWRSMSADLAAASVIASTPTSPYADTSAQAGSLYYYWVQGTNAYTNVFSASNTGYSAIAPPTGVTASDGTVSGKVVVSWNTNGCTNAAGCIVWRNVSNDWSSATLLASLTSASYDDTSVLSNRSCWYWVQATNAMSASTNSVSMPDAGYWAQTYYVTTNGSETNDGTGWGAALASIEQAAAAAGSVGGGVVLVSNGTYAVNGTIVLTNGVTVSGVGATRSDVIVDGGGINRCFVLTSSNAMVENLTIVHGYASDGGGVWMSNGAVRNCAIQNSVAANSGGGLWVAQGLITNCLIGGNVAVQGSGGGVYGTNATIRNCTVVNNAATNMAVYGQGGGGGLYLVGNAVVQDSSISNNLAGGYGLGGGGVYLADAAQALNCAIVGNQAFGIGAACDGGGGMYVSGSALAQTCTISNNLAKSHGGGVFECAGGTVADSQIVNNQALMYGGGVIQRLSGGVVRNCLVSGNLATNTGYGIGGGGYAEWSSDTNAGFNACTLAGNRAIRGGGLYVGLTTGQVLNCVIYTNTAIYPTHHNLYLYSSAQSNQFRRCCTPVVFTNTANNNITSNPLFQAAGAGNYRLGNGSPCVDTGTNAAWMAGALDVDEHVRVMGVRVDRGCYEYPLYLQVSPTIYTNSVMSGAVASATVQLWNLDTNAALQWTASSTNDWLSMGPSAGTIPLNGTNALIVTNGSTGLTAGSYTGVVIVTATNGLAGQYPAQTQTVTVVMKVQALAVNPAGLTNDVVVGNTPESQTVKVISSGIGTVNYTLATNVFWLAVSPVSGTLTNNQTNTITVTYANTTDWGTGTSNGLIRVTSTAPQGATQDVAVTLNVTSGQGLRAEGVGGFSVPGNGACGVTATSGEGAADLSIHNLVVLPAVLQPGAHPETVGCVLRNAGPADVAAPNNRLRMEVYLTPNDAGRAEAILLGRCEGDLDLPAGTSWMGLIPMAGLAIPADAYGVYHVLAAVRSLTGLPDPILANNVGVRWGTIAVGPGVGTAFVPIMGDFDGDGKTDPALYQESSGDWYAALSGSGYGWVRLAGFGGSGYRPLPADYDNDGTSDPAVYNVLDGQGYCRLSGQGYALAGGRCCDMGYEPVAGDYDGDGQIELALYQEALGVWSVPAEDGKAIVTQADFGGWGRQPVAGDYDGDGRTDMALYERASGTWLFRLSAQYAELLVVTECGSPDEEPAVGDYDGDGKTDLALFNPLTGAWTFRLSGNAYAPVLWANSGDGRH